MSKAFLTEPKVADKKVTSRSPFEYKEQVQTALQKFGVPFRKAELAVIDMRATVIKGYKKKWKPIETAVTMIDEVRRVYKVEAEKVT